MLSLCPSAWAGSRAWSGAACCLFRAPSSPTTGAAGQCDGSVFNLWRNRWTAFQSSSSHSLPEKGFASNVSIWNQLFETAALASITSRGGATLTSVPPAAESRSGVTDQMLDGGTQTSGQEPSGRGCCNGQAERQCPGAWNLCFGGPVPLLGTLRWGLSTGDSPLGTLCWKFA